MKWDEFRRSENIEDFTDINKPVENKMEAHETINERLELVNSKLAKDAGGDDLKDFKKAIKRMEEITNNG